MNFLRTITNFTKGKKAAAGTKSQPEVSKPISDLKHDMRSFQFDGFDQNRTQAPYVEILPDDFLKELNSILDWNCYTVDLKGRRFGKPTGPNKRIEPQIVPDYRTPELHKRFDLSTKTVLEVGCFEGVHTIGLCQVAKAVKAVDSRVENVVKTMVRTSFYGHHPQVFRIDLEKLTETEMKLMRSDVLHHVGVLYHLSDPVKHIQQLPSYIDYGVMLDTHIATEKMVNSEYEVNGKIYKYYRHRESGYRDVFSGMLDHAKWLLLSDLELLLKQAGFPNIEVLEMREERNGPRVLLFASK